MTTPSQGEWLSCGMNFSPKAKSFAGQGRKRMPVSQCGRRLLSSEILNDS